MSTLPPNITNPINDLTVLEDAVNTTLDLFSNFDDPLTTGQVATFELYSTELAGGLINVLLFDQAGEGAPATVQNFINYVNDDDYVNSIIHRSAPNFVVQGGGFTVENLQIGVVPSDPPVVNEFSSDRSNLRGTIAMAKLSPDAPSGGPDSATNQWFFNLGDNSANLDNQNGGFTVFGEVLSDADLAVIDAIADLPIFNGISLNSAFSNLPLQIDPENPSINEDNDYVRFREIRLSNIDELTFSVVSNTNPNLVDASIDNNQLILDYLDDQTGTAEITIEATTLFGNTVQDTFIINVNEVDDNPVAVDDEYSVNEDETLTIAATGILGNDTDVDGDALTSVLVDAPTNGSLTLNTDGSFEYTPDANFNGTDTFTYQANDGVLNSDIATVTITVDPVNDNPVADDDEYSVNEDETLTITATGVLGNDTDIDGNALTSVLVDAPTNGSLTLNTDGSFEYTPDADFNGTDTFTYQANDGELNSDIATVTITVDPVNDNPVAFNDQYTVNEDETLTIDAVDGVLENDTDIDGDALTSVFVTGVSNGSLTLNTDGSFEYTPNADFDGTDTFTYQANDGGLNSEIATVTIIIAPDGEAPVAADDQYTVNEDETLTIAATGVLGNDTDVDGNALTSILVTGVSNGSLTLNTDGSFEYIPNADFNGTDTFTYQANDGVLNSDIATVTITVDPVNDNPVADDDQYSVNEDETLTIAADGVLGNDTDIDGDALTAVLVDAPTNGSLTFNTDGSFEYTPDAHFNGTDTFTYQANDGVLNSDIATVTITVDPVNNNPVAVDEQYSVNEDETLTIAADGVLGNDTDIDGDALTSVLVTGVSNGSLTLNTDGSFEYTPDADFSGIDTFTYRANDGELNSNIATVTITVDPEEDAPVATGDQYSVNEAGTLTILLDGVLRNDIDFDGDTLTSILVDEPTNGILSFNANGSFEYTPDADFSGIDTFTYRASDGVLNSDIVTVIITVDPVSEPPVFGSLDSDILDAGITPGFDGTDNIAFSGSGDDLIDVVAGTGDNRLYGQSGNDTLTLGGGDRAFGGSGDDQFFLLGGNNAVTGGLGADQFWIANAEIPESRHIITDFNLEDDLLNIAGLGVGSFSDLTLSNEDGNALIAFDDNELATLLRVDADSLTADNFGVLS